MPNPSEIERQSVCPRCEEASALLSQLARENETLRAELDEAKRHRLATVTDGEPNYCPD